MNTIISATTGKRIPVTTDLNIHPLTHPYLKGTIDNNQWRYVKNPNYGLISINVNRANFCEKVYLMNTKIADSIDGSRRITDELKEFIKNVSDSLVYYKDGIAYRVFLKKLRNGYYDLDSVKPFWSTVGLGGIGSLEGWKVIDRKYNS